MDVMALEHLVSNIDLRLSRIEQILPTLATKDDLKTGPADCGSGRRYRGTRSRMVPVAASTTTSAF
jgi:hypothetical protein